MCVDLWCAQSLDCGTWSWDASGCDLYAVGVVLAVPDRRCWVCFVVWENLLVNGMEFHSAGMMELKTQQVTNRGWTSEHFSACQKLRFVDHREMRELTSEGWAWRTAVWVIVTVLNWIHWWPVAVVSRLTDVSLIITIPVRVPVYIRKQSQ